MDIGGSVVPINWGSKLQGAVSTSTTEAEAVAMVKCVKEAFKVSCFLSQGDEEPPPRTVITDCTPLVKALKKGYSDQLNHMRRTHRIAFQWLREIAANNRILDVPTNSNPADIFTKGLNRIKHQQHRESIMSGGLMSCVPMPKSTGTRGSVYVDGHNAK
eukprot:GHVN01077609.1.p3 GENE.GHVN01077609.1~~GHVN01077609.1.p3  ORF type:complete len:159 (+),score=19.91 GHVN01077609.1:2015-2491(+)